LSTKKNIWKIPENARRYWQKQFEDKESDLKSLIHHQSGSKVDDDGESQTTLCNNKSESKLIKITYEARRSSTSSSTSAETLLVPTMSELFYRL
jgi:hypothetical protein